MDYSIPEHISPPARNLIHRLLQKDPKNREKLATILTHPFFDSKLPITPLSIRNSVFKPLRKISTTVNTNTASRVFQNENKSILKPSCKENLLNSNEISTSLKNRGLKNLEINSQSVAEKQIINEFSLFSTIRLKPMKQKTKHGVIEIKADSNVLLDFKEEKYLMLITSSGDQVNNAFIMHRFICVRVIILRI
jgi:serine/threonine protein kinase